MSTHLRRYSVLQTAHDLDKMDPTRPLQLQQNFPVVIRNKINNWKMLHYTKEDWCNLFKDKPLKFRQGQKTFNETPYWEHLCESTEMSLKEFFELSTKDSNQFLYFDYKYVKDVFPGRETLINDLKWSDVGLFDVPEEESALWIGNEGAHTPCHKDTYGCNFVAQLYGRKLWILMPPEESENLMPVRIPYEESSVYSLFNFYAPTEGLQGVKQAYKTILSPGDVLYVPRHWWHYVENLEPAISINIWIPLEEDHESRLEESLIRHYISNICQDLSEEEAKQILNPNEYNLISEPCTIGVIEKCLENYKKHKDKTQPHEGPQIKVNFQSQFSGIEKLSMESFIKEKTIKSRLSFASSKQSPSGISNKVSIAKTLINAYCSQLNINLIKKALLEQ